MHLTDGISITKNLNALITGDFIVKYVPFGFNKRKTHYKLVDPFCLFYLKLVKELKTTNEKF